MIEGYQISTGYRLREDGTGRGCLHDGSGRIPTHEEWVLLKRKLDAFYANTSSVSIAIHNAQAQEEVDALLRGELGQDAVPEPIAGYVYAMLADNGLVKIGKSKTPGIRLDRLDVVLPYRMSLLCCFAADDALAEEKALHERFTDRRVNGEWFDLTNADITYLKTLDEDVAR